MSEKIIINEKKITSVVGNAVPKPADNQNTDDMVYGATLNRITFRGYGKELFKNERKDNPNHPLNNPEYANATILIGGENYGCGSSREHAPQAHLDSGLKGLITAGYAGIFQANCAAIGLVAVTVPKQDISNLAKMIEKHPNTELKINLIDKNISYEIKEGHTENLLFDILENVRQSFLNGTWDAMAVLQQNQERIEKTKEKLDYLRFE